MKIMHLTFCFHPELVGGTEVYVENLAKYLRKHDMQSIIAVPDRIQEAAYMHDDLPVRRFIALHETSLRDFYGEGDAQTAQNFAKLLDIEQPDIVHFHVPWIALRLLQEIRKRHIALLFTYHLPFASCPRGDLLHQGKHICDGKLHTRTCARCMLQGKGLGSIAGHLVGGLPLIVGRKLGDAGLTGGLWTALRMTELVQIRHQAFLAFVDQSRYIVSLCKWTRELLLRNGIAEEKVVLSPHGIVWESQDEMGTVPHSGPLRVAYVGRLGPIKGVDILIKAVRALPANVPLELHLFGIPQSADYLVYLEELASHDTRIVFHPPLPNKQVVSLLRTFHLLAVPSQWLETGPLVVLEAFAAGIPVLGSNRGGIAELVTDGVNGMLIDPVSPESWQHTLHKLAAERKTLQQLRAGVQPPRHMREVAADMAELYRHIHR